MTNPRLVVGVDIGNSTTEACVATVAADGTVDYLGTALAVTTGVKGTSENSAGVVRAVRDALERARRRREDVELVLLNEATPVISGLAMETITETIITESTMIGHNPATPGGVGVGVGTTVSIDALAGAEGPVVCVVPAGWDFDDIAVTLNRALHEGIDLVAAVLGGDDAVLVTNRLEKAIPVVDEVTAVAKVPLGMLAAVEVAPPGRTIRRLSDSYGLASVFDLDPDQTRKVSPVARALTGNRSAVVVRTPSGDITDRRIPVGALELHGAGRTLRVDLDEGAEAIMEALGRVQPLEDARGEPGTHVGGMLASVRDTMADVLSDEDAEATAHAGEDIAIRDVLAVDTVVPAEVRGGLAGEVALENAVALAAMVRTSGSRMRVVADRVAADLDRVDVRIGGVEGEMAVRGALTTPGVDTPIAVLDLGGGSTDAALLTRDGRTDAVHVAGAGELVTKLIDSELALDNREVAEAVKRHPLAKVESFFQVRHEDGTVQFFTEPLSPAVFARVVTLGPNGPEPVDTRHGVDHVRRIRRGVKQRVFAVNAVRALRQVAPGGNLRALEFVVLLGGSALDFEIPDLIADALAPYGIVCGIGNIHGTEGPRNAVASGLVDAWATGR